jgi:hypothetical protein
VTLRRRLRNSAARVAFMGLAMACGLLLDRVVPPVSGNVLVDIAVLSAVWLAVFLPLAVRLEARLDARGREEDPAAG